MSLNLKYPNELVLVIRTRADVQGSSKHPVIYTKVLLEPLPYSSKTLPFNEVKQHPSDMDAVNVIQAAILISLILLLRFFHFVSRKYQN